MLNITGVCVFSLAALEAGVFDKKCMKKNLIKGTIHSVGIKLKTAYLYIYRYIKSLKIYNSCLFFA